MNIDYLRSKLLAAPAPFEYRLYVDAASRERLLAAIAERDKAAEDVERLRTALPEERRARSIGSKPPRQAADQRLTDAEAAVEAAEAEAEHVILRWLPQDPDSRDRLVDALTVDGQLPTEWTFNQSRVAETFTGAFAPNGESLHVEWAAIAPGLNVADRDRIAAGVHHLNERANGSPFSPASSGQPGTSSKPA